MKITPKPVRLKGEELEKALQKDYIYQVTKLRENWEISISDLLTDLHYPAKSTKKAIDKIIKSANPIQMKVLATGYRSGMTMEEIRDYRGEPFL